MSVCGFVCMCGNSVTLFMFECVKTVQNSHTAHIAPGLYPCNCRSQSDIVLLWLLSMVLHISPEMTKSLSQCSWPPASLLVLLHSHPLMWPWIGIGHQPHSRDWYRLCCSHAYRSSELSGQLASVWLSACVSCLLSSTKMGGTVSAITLKIEVPIQTMFKWELVEKNSSYSQNAMTKCRATVHPHPYRLKKNKFYFMRKAKGDYISCKRITLTVVYQTIVW